MAPAERPQRWRGFFARGSVGGMGSWKDDRSWEKGESAEAGNRFRGMTINERLFEAGLVGAFDDAVARKDKPRIIELLGDVGLYPKFAEFVADEVINRKPLPPPPRDPTHHRMSWAEIGCAFLGVAILLGVLGLLLAGLAALP